MPKTARRLRQTSSHRLVEFARVEERDTAMTRSMYSAACTRLRLASSPKEAKTLRLKGGTTKTVQALPLNTCADGAGKGWPCVYVAEPQKGQIALCYQKRGSEELLSLDWDDLWGRDEFRGSESEDKERRNRADLIFYIQKLLSLI